VSIIAPDEAEPKDIEAEPKDIRESKYIRRDVRVAEGARLEIV
jgi:hypothetical protein